MKHRVFAWAFSPRTCSVGLGAARNAACAAIVALGAFAVPAVPALLPLALADCAGQTPAQDVAQAASDAALVASGLAAVVPELAAIQGFPAPVLAKVRQYAAQVQATATAIQQAATADAAQPLVQQLVSLANAMVDALPAGLLPPGVAVAVASAQVLLPVIEAAVGLIPTGATAAHAAGMTPAQARAVLRAAH